jgi:Putative transposase
LGEIQTINEETGAVIFTYKDYGDNATQKQMTLTSDEFIRPFTRHIFF